LTVEDSYEGFKHRVEDKVLDVFLVIPYANPPIGDLRFKNPNLIKALKANAIKANKWPIIVCKMRSVCK